jgi:chemotaxis protein methyltransferase CheR
MSLTDPNLEIAWLRGYLAGRTGVVVPDDRPDFVAGRLGPVLRAHKLDTLPQLVAAIRGGNRAVLSATVDALTTHETSFFRDPDVYTWLEMECLPTLVSFAAGRELAFWSAACSTGQEALSVAMLMLERWPHVPFRVAGTDISPGTVEKARAGAFSMLDVNRGLPAKRLVRWFARSGVDYKAVPDLMGRVNFEVHNLLQRGGPAGPFDLILLRNVLVYLNDSDRDTVFRNLAAALRPGGIVLLGTAEALIEPPAGLFTRSRSARTSWLVRA